MHYTFSLAINNNIRVLNHLLKYYKEPYKVSKVEQYFFVLYSILYFQILLESNLPGPTDKFSLYHIVRSSYAQLELEIS